MTDVRLIHGSALHIPLDDESIQCVVTSPPYWGLRQYAGEQREVWGGDAGCAHEWAETPPLTQRIRNGAPGGLHEGRETNTLPIHIGMSGGAFCACGAWYGALGLEPTPDLYVEHMVAIFREVRRVLRKDGTLWLNLGDSYASQGVSGLGTTTGHGAFRGGAKTDSRIREAKTIPPGLKPKDLVGIPWMVAFALRADGWYLRSDIIWHKPNPMPESVTDRPTKSHEYLFLLTKSERYYYDADAIREPSITAGDNRAARTDITQIEGRGGDESRKRTGNPTGAERNKRTVWTIATRPYKGAHFATFPPDLVEPCVLAGSSPKACGVCGAPWERVTERPKPPEVEASSLDRFGTGDAGVHRKVGQAYQDWLDANPKQTTGWRSTCDHEDDSGSCVVLDPFNGSGTTGQVAVRLGRSYVGVDISKEYLDEQAVRRIYDVQMEAAL